jgi:hypothetical protein
MKPESPALPYLFPLPLKVFYTAPATGVLLEQKSIQQFPLIALLVVNPPPDCQAPSAPAVPSFDHVLHDNEYPMKVAERLACRAPECSLRTPVS